MDRPTCRTCPHWNGNATGGWCHRYPPTIKLTDGVYLQPRTQEKDFCGEHPDFPAFIESRKAAVPRG